MVEPACYPEQVLERAGQRAVSGPAREQQGAVDVEEKDLGEHR
jgi:hypothetical protein